MRHAKGAMVTSNRIINAYKTNSNLRLGFTPEYPMSYNKFLFLLKLLLMMRW